MIVIESDNNISTNHFRSMSQILGSDFIPSDIESTFDFITIAGQGIHAKVIRNFSQHFDIPRDQMAQFMNVSEPTIYRWIKSNKVLDRHHSVQLLELTDLFLFGISVLEDQENFFKWLELNNAALGGLKPLDLLDLPGGLDKVRDVLGRMEYGVYS